MTKTKRYVDSITGIVTAIGNSGHITLPKDWIGQEVYVTSLAKAKEMQLDKVMKKYRIRNIK